MNGFTVACMKMECVSFTSLCPPIFGLVESDNQCDYVLPLTIHLIAIYKSGFRLRLGYVF